MGKVRVAINGFGRIGTTLTRIYFHYPQYQELFDLTAIGLRNVTPEKMREKAHRLRHDTAYHRFPLTLDREKAIPVYLDEERRKLLIAGKEIEFVTDFEGAPIPNWGNHGVDIVIDATGEYRKRERAQSHLDAGAKKVVITAPGKDEDVAIVLGVDDHLYDPKNHHIISSSSCTTTCLATVAHVLEKEFGLEGLGFATTHALTKTQNILDGSNEDLRRGRSASSIIPASTGASKEIKKIIPALKGKSGGHSLRVPVDTVSILSIFALLAKQTSVEELNNTFRRYAESKNFGRYFGFSQEMLVSSDIVADSRSAIIDAEGTLAITPNMFGILAWYDNEWGYSSRVADLTALIAQKLGGN